MSSSGQLVNQRADVYVLDVVENRKVAENIFLLSMKGDLAEQKIQPGQFVHIRCGDSIYPLLRRPLSICDVNNAESTLSVIYRVDGDGTRYLSQLQPGNMVDVLGPLGTGFPIEERTKEKQVLIIGGGVGVPPLYYLSKTLVEQGVEVTHLLGFNRRQDSFLTSQFSQLGPTYVTTLDGSLGEQGVVTQLLGHQVKADWSLVYTCGPLPMLRAVEAFFQERETEVYLSLEQRMGCGIGACLACVCHTPESSLSYKKVCTDGPVFRAGEVIL